MKTIEQIQERIEELVITLAEEQLTVLNRGSFIRVVGHLIAAERLRAQIEILRWAGDSPETLPEVVRRHINKKR